MTKTNYAQYERIEEKIRELICVYLSEDDARVASIWLERHIAVYAAAEDLEILPIIDAMYDRMSAHCRMLREKREKATVA